jgi:hypothetical protein
VGQGAYEVHTLATKAKVGRIFPQKKGLGQNEKWHNVEFQELEQTHLVTLKRCGARLEMAMGKNPLGITCPNPYPRIKFTPAKKLIPMTGIKFCPNPYPCGFRVPNGFPIPTNINIKINLSCK